MDIETLKRMFKDYPPLIEILNQTPIDWPQLISNIKKFQEKHNDREAFEKATHFTKHMTEALEHLIEHGHILERQNPQGMSRRDFLRGGAALAGVAALSPFMADKARAEIIKPNVTYENYKQFVYSRGNCIVMYTRESRNPGSDGELFMEALENKLGNRISFYRINMDNWTYEGRQDWIRTENEKDIIPSYHIIINNIRQTRIRGPPDAVGRAPMVDKVDSYLKSKGI